MIDTTYYDNGAEFYDLSALGSGWMGDLPQDALRYFRPKSGPLIDLAAGTGLSTIALADAVTGADIVAVEPSAGMRAALTAKIVERSDLRSRVTIVAGDLASAWLPKVWGGLTARGLLGQFADDQRLLLWDLLRERLAPGAGAVIDQVREAPAKPDEDLYSSTVSVGQFDYLITIGMDGSVTDQPCTVITYRVTDHETGEIVRTFEQRNRVWPVSRSQLRDELSTAGLSARPINDAAQLIIRQSEL